MSTGATAVLLLVATVTAVDADRARLGAGLIDGLRVGDRGSVHYELVIGSESRRVDVGVAEVIEVDERGSTLELRADRPVRPNYRVRFELPASRVEPAELVRLARERLQERPFDAVAERLLNALVPPDPEVEERLIELLERRREERGEAPVEPRPAAEPAAAPVLPVRVILPVPGGSYIVGIPLEQAKFFNQQPQFEVELRDFLIDREPVRQRSLQLYRPDFVFPEADPAGPATAVPFELAQEYCRSENGRLPTEFEWQAAVESGSLTTPADLLEWTASWYKAYPGNVMPEKAYGETYRVLRGAAAADDPARHLRRYMDPAERNTRVGFRCVFPAERSAGSALAEEAHLGGVDAAGESGR